MNQYKDSQGNVFDEDELRVKAQEQGIEFGEFLADFQLVGSIKTEGNVEGQQIEEPKPETYVGLDKEGRIKQKPFSSTSKYKNIRTNKIIDEKELLNTIKETGKYNIPNSGGRLDVEQYMYDNDIGKTTKDGFGPSISVWEDVDVQGNFNVKQTDNTIDTEVDSLYNIPTEDFFKSDTVVVKKAIDFTNQGNFTRDEYVNFLGEQSEKPAFQDELDMNTAMLNEIAVKQNKPKPTEDEIKEYTKNQIIRNQKAQRKLNNYSELARDATDEERAVIQGKKTEQLTSNQKIMAQASKELDDNYKGINNQIENLQSSPEAQYIKDLVSDERIFGALGEDEYYFTLQTTDGKTKKIPSRYLEKYKLAAESFDNKRQELFDQRQIAIEKYKSVVSEDLINDSEELSMQIDVLKKDYDLSRKFFNNLSISSQIAGLNLLDAITYSTTIDELQIKKREERQDIADKFSYNISFEDAFKSKENFGEFFLQESAAQIPIFATMAATTFATGGLGALQSLAATATVIGASSFNEQKATMQFEEILSKQNDFDFDDVEYTDSQKLLIPAGFALAEAGFSAIPGSFLLSRGAKIMAGATGRSIETGAFNYFKRNVIPGIAIPTGVEAFSEGLTSATQNLFLGRPVLENVGHAAFTGGMFGGGLGGLSVVTGSIASKFSDYESFAEIRGLSDAIEDIKISTSEQIAKIVNEKPSQSQQANPITFKQNKKDRIENVEEESKQQINELFNKQKELLKTVDKKIRDVGDAEFDDYAAITSEQELLRTKFKDLQKSDKSSLVKKREAIELKQEFDLLQKVRDSFRNVKERGNIDREFTLLEGGDKKQRAKFEDLKQKATQRLIDNSKDEDGNTDLKVENLKEEDIKDEAKTIFIEQKVDAEIASAEANEENLSFLKIKVRSFKTAEEAAAATGSGYAKTSNGLFKRRDVNNPNSTSEIVLIRDNMIENKRVGTGIHEISHALLFESLALDTEQTLMLAEHIKNYLYLTNRAAYTRMFQGKGRKGEKDRTMLIEQDEQGFVAEEVIVNFMEAVSNNQIDLTSVENRSLAKTLGPIINNSLFRRTGKQKTIEWKGEQDMVNFIAQMAKKLKDGTFTQEDFNAIRKDRTILKNENPTTIDETYREYRRSKIESDDTQDIQSDDDIDVSKLSKQTAKNINEIYEQQGTDGLFDIANELIVTKDNNGNIIPDKFGYIGTIVEKRKGVPNYEQRKDEIIFETVYGTNEPNGQTGLPALLRTYDPNKGVPLAAYLYSNLPKRIVGIANKYLNAGDDGYTLSLSREDNNFLENVTESLSITQEDISQTQEDIQLEEERVSGLIDPKTLMDESLSEKAKNNISKNISELKPDQISFKSLPDLSEETTAERFQIPVKKLIPKNNFTQGELKNTMRNLDDMFEDFVKIFPKGAVTNKEVTQALYGTSTGLPTNVLTAFYKKGDRIDTASGLPIYELAPITKEQFRQELGILPDGTIPDKVFVQSPQAQTAKGLAIMFGKLVTNTTVRQELQKQPGQEQAALDISSGKSEYMRSAAFHEVFDAREQYFFDKNEDFINKINATETKAEAMKVFDALFAVEGLKGEDKLRVRVDQAIKAFNNLKNKPDDLMLGEYITNKVVGGALRVSLEKAFGLTEGSVDPYNLEKNKSARKALQAVIDTLTIEEVVKYILPTARGSWGLIPIKKRDGESYNYVLQNGKFVLTDVKKSIKSRSFLIIGNNDLIDNFLSNRVYDNGQLVFKYEPGSGRRPGRYFYDKLNEQTNKSERAEIPTNTTNIVKVGKGKKGIEKYIENLEKIKEVTQDQRNGLEKILFKLDMAARDPKTNVSFEDVAMILNTFNSSTQALIRTAATPGLITKAKINDNTDLIYEHRPPVIDVIRSLAKSMAAGNIQKDFNTIMNNFKAIVVTKEEAEIVDKFNKDFSILDSEGKTQVIKDTFVPDYNTDLVKKLNNGKGIELYQADKQLYQRSAMATEAPLSDRFNGIIEETKGNKSLLAAADKVIPEVIARQQGASIGKYKFFVPPSAEDFMGLMYSFMGKGTQGDLHKQFFEETLNKPYKRGIAQLESAKQKIERDYKELREKYPKVSKKLTKKMPGTEFTYDQAIRIFLWKSGGFDMTETGLEPETAEGRKLINDAFFAVAKDRDLQQFARGVGLMSGQEKGWIDPSRDWIIDNIASDLNNISDKIGRKEFLQEFTDNYKEIFNKQNLNKIEAIYGSRFRHSLEDILFRMEKGTNRNFGSEDARANSFADFLNGSVGAIMFFNMRSAALQTLSAANYINWSDNNIYAAGKAFANIPQYYADVATLFNSDKLKQRRKGFKIDVNQAELVRSIEGQKNKFKAALRYLLKIGFTPTQAVDSLAIATGGATFYRNRTKTYQEQGLSLKEAEAKAFEDFSEITDQSQQSSDPAMVSEQQANKFSRWVLSFQNTSMQYNRLIKKAALDIANNRGNTKENVSKILYYSFVQNFTFNALSSALFAVALGSSDDDEKDKQKILRTANGMADTILKGAGYHGAIVAMLKNTAFEIHKQESKSWGKDYVYVLLSMLNVAPAVGSKFSKGYKIQKTYEFQKDLIKERGFYPGTLNPSSFGKKQSFGFKGTKNIIDNPAYMMVGYGLSVVNIPLDRVIKKVSNASYALDNTTKGWQKTALMFGFSTWDLDLKNADGLIIKERAQDQRRKAGYKKAAETRRKNNPKLTPEQKRRKRTLELNK